jgi:hypothetical protein
LSAAVLPLRYLGLVAIVPIVLGTRRLLELFNGRANVHDVDDYPNGGGSYTVASETWAKTRVSSPQRH